MILALHFKLYKASVMQFNKYKAEPKAKVLTAKLTPHRPLSGVGLTASQYAGAPPSKSPTLHRLWYYEGKRCTTEVLHSNTLQPHGITLWGFFNHHDNQRTYRQI